MNDLQGRTRFQIQQARFLWTDGDARIHDQRRLASGSAFPQQVEDGFDGEGLIFHVSILPHLGLLLQRRIIGFAATKRAGFGSPFSKKILFFLWVLLTAYSYIE